MNFDIEEELYLVPLNYSKFDYLIKGVSDSVVYVVFDRDNFEVSLTNLFTKEIITMSHEHLFERFTPFWLQGDDWLEIWGNKNAFGQILEFKYQNMDLWITIEENKENDRRMVYSEPYNKFIQKWKQGKYKFEEDR